MGSTHGDGPRGRRMQPQSRRLAVTLVHNPLRRWYGRREGAMEFGILGPLEVREEDRVLKIRGRKQRALLALLLVNANRTLAISRIVDELWGEQAPEAASKMVQIYVSQLRK